MIDKSKQLTNESLEKLLSAQTDVILGAVDSKLSGWEKRTELKLSSFERHFDTQLNGLDQRLIKVENKINELITTLDAFLKKLTDTMDEFAVMKSEVTKIKQVLRDKLGVDVETL